MWEIATKKRLGSRISPIPAYLNELQGPVKAQVEHNRAEDDRELLAEIEAIKPSDMPEDSVSCGVSTRDSWSSP